MATQKGKGKSGGGGSARSPVPKQKPSSAPSAKSEEPKKKKKKQTGVYMLAGIVVLVGFLAQHASCASVSAKIPNPFRSSYEVDGVTYYKKSQMTDLPQGDLWQPSCDTPKCRVSTWPKLFRKGEVSPWIKCVGFDCNVLYECKTCKTYEEQVAAVRVECDPPPPNGEKCTGVNPFKGKRVVALSDHKIGMIVQFK